MKKEYIVKKSKEIEEIFKNKNIIYGKYLKIYFLKKDKNIDHFRFALSISKKIGKAHIRNYYKRWLRNIIRNFKEKIPNDIEFLVVFKNSIVDSTYNDCQNDFDAILKKYKKVNK